MNYKRFLFLIVLFVSCLADLQASVSIVPIPNQITWNNGVYKLKQTVSISYSSDHLKSAALYLAENLHSVLGVKSKVKLGGNGNIRLSLTNDQSLGASGYRLTVDKNGVNVVGCDYNGVVCAIATIRQMAMKTELQYVSITDRPHFVWRGFMLDCSRHFFSKKEIEELINLMALYKLDRFHWHLTDDQGWRIEIKQYPLLTLKGAWRKYNNQDSICMQNARLQDNKDLNLPQENKRIEGKDTLYGGYYSQDDIREMVAYAKQRGIEIIPEIDMPGHFLSAVSNYKGLSCFDKVGWGRVFSSPICPGKDSALEFCRNVWKEIFALFPYEYVHIGGDEVEKGNWKKCPDCQRRIKENNLKNEEELQSWFIHQMEKYFNENGRKMIGWDEILEGGLSKSATVSWWRTWVPDAVDQVTAHGNDVIYCPGSPMYFSQHEQNTSLNEIYTYDLQPSRLSDSQKSHVLGVQANLWAEGIPSRNRMFYMYFPRILALSELAWSNPKNMNFVDFYNRLTYQFEMLHRMGVPYRTPSLYGFNNINVFTKKGTLTVGCKDSLATVRYTTDGSFPNCKSTLYTNPVTVDETTHFILRAFNPEGRADEMVKADFVKQGFLESLDIDKKLTSGLSAEWHEFPGVKCSLIGNAPLNGVYDIDDVMIPSGVKGNIGLIIQGYIKVPADGVYTFALMSDDGSWLKIDGNMVVDNDREQSPHEMICQQALKAGLHRMEVRYFDHNGGMLRLRVSDQQGQRLNPKDIYVH